MGGLCAGPPISCCRPWFIILQVEGGIIRNWCAKLKSGCRNMLYTLNLYDNGSFAEFHVCNRVRHVYSISFNVC